MYPKEMQDLTTWEREQCPWWIDLEKGHVLGREKDAYALHGGDGLSSCDKVNGML